jgi:hypothetical protein
MTQNMCPKTVVPLRAMNDLLSRDRRGGMDSIASVKLSVNLPLKDAITSVLSQL